ncbi:hypothetical protein [Ramlibacter sp. PS4R-6]|uniref:hypothetical protein n=1 Tax=Ramlibacter sp. PS4R-6 TaxID=3133438 RepID=UPI0030A58380
MIYAITPKGHVVLRSAARWGLSRHLRELLAFCDPAMRVEQARQFFPPDSLQIALYALQQLELIDGPPVEAPRVNTTWAAQPVWRRAPGELRDQPDSTPA